MEGGQYLGKIGYMTHFLEPSVKEESERVSFEWSDEEYAWTLRFFTADEPTRDRLTASWERFADDLRSLPETSNYPDTERYLALPDYVDRIDNVVYTLGDVDAADRAEANQAAKEILRLLRQLESTET